MCAPYAAFINHNALSQVLQACRDLEETLDLWEHQVYQDPQDSADL